MGENKEEDTVSKSDLDPQERTAILTKADHQSAPMASKESKSDANRGRKAVQPKKKPHGKKRDHKAEAKEC